MSKWLLFHVVQLPPNLFALCLVVVYQYEEEPLENLFKMFTLNIQGHILQKKADICTKCSSVLVFSYNHYVLHKNKQDTSIPLHWLLCLIYLISSQL